VRRVVNNPQRVSSPALSPDGRSVAFQTTSDLGVETLLVQTVPTLPSAAVPPPRVLATGGSPQWSRDGARILFTRRQFNQANLFVIKADGSEKDDTLKPYVSDAVLGRWSTDERQLATVVPTIQAGVERWQIQVQTTDTLRPTLKLALPEALGQVVGLDWSPAGDQLLLSMARQAKLEGHVVELKSLEVRRLPEARAIGTPGHPCWSGTGAEILFRASGDSALTPQRLCVMKSDGSGLRVLWEAPSVGMSIRGISWQRWAPLELAGGGVALPPPLPPPAVSSADPGDTRPLPTRPLPTRNSTAPPKPAPSPIAPGATPGRRLLASRVFQVPQAASPVSVPLGPPPEGDFEIQVPVKAHKGWAPRKQGVGISVELADGSLYRGTAIYFGSLWGMLQGRARGAKVRIIEAKQLQNGDAGFERGFVLSVRRQGPQISVSVNGKQVLARRVLSAAVQSLSLTLENFEEGTARVPLGTVTLSSDR
jgi:hypothetical protein